ncbi:MAG TPA: haloacid dehalogenase-like hydrolase [Terriglobales bacterium]|nr:haloacid dehalogenase-like hydrolase [Terriglobales bacterium]
MTQTNAQQFVEKILAMRPRVAVFDCDGTLWENNSGEDFLEWSMQHKLVSDETAAWMRKRYDEYKAGDVGEAQMCGEMVTMYAGNTVATMEAAAQEFVAEIVAPNLFPEMLELTRRLAAQRCNLWAVSSTNEWVVREGVKTFEIPGDHVLAGTAAIVDDMATKQLTNMPSGDGKATALRNVVVPRHGRMDVVFGNSIHDAAMLRMAEQGFAVNPNPDLEKMAGTYGWTIYWPEKIAVKL